MDDGTRTHDNRDHNPGLYQLSYAHHRPARRATGVPSRLKAKPSWVVRGVAACLALFNKPFKSRTYEVSPEVRRAVTVPFATGREVYTNFRLTLPPFRILALPPGDRPAKQAAAAPPPPLHRYQTSVRNASCQTHKARNQVPEARIRVN